MVDKWKLSGSYLNDLIFPMFLLLRTSRVKINFTDELAE